MEKAIRVLVANRPRMMRELILATFADQPDIEIVGEVATDEEIPNTVARTMPDLVVVALDEPGRRPRVCDVVLRQHPEVKIIGEIPSLLQQLNPLCIPIRAVLDWGEGVKISDQLFDLGGIQMLDLKPTAAESVSYFRYEASLRPGVLDRRPYFSSSFVNLYSPRHQAHFSWPHPFRARTRRPQGPNL